MTVTTGGTRTGVNAALAAGGAVSGTVTDAGGIHHGLENVWVWVWSSSTGAGNGARTAANGTYTVTGLPAGTDYQACFQPEPNAVTGGSADTPGYAWQCYNNQPPSGTPTPVTVTAGANRTGIDAALAGGGAISGTVTDAGDTHALANINVWVNSPSTGQGWGSMTDQDGKYTLVVLPGTDYQVCFNAPGYVDQCYNDQPPSTPTPVTVTLGGTSTGINAALVAGAGGGISGTTPSAKGRLSPTAPIAGDADRWLAVHKRAADQGFSRPLALIRLGTVLSPYRIGFRAVAQSQQSRLKRDALARHSSPGLPRS